MPEDRRDLTLSVLAREAVIAAITTDTPAAAAPGPVGAAVALGAVLPRTTALSGRERASWRSGSTASSPGPGTRHPAGSSDEGAV
ncbi:hypothetical protein OG552_32890 [Streptomyces sp. NBC_01476]|uniref:hypothetical protein n=1 Tax=Streptomyces sp. NBC_01476 TaxID=2903881 RepID=UPI002E375FC0|nr:hypothetical protein [Streptomyces sp. NBC_01476]